MPVRYNDIMWEEHAGTAETLGLSQGDYRKLFSEIAASIFAAYTERRDGELGEVPTALALHSLRIRVLQADLATTMVLQNLAHFKYKIIDPD